MPVASARDFWRRFDQRPTTHGDPPSPVWSSIYCTIRERRRSRSNSTTGRSRTPSSVSSGRTTPSPGPSFLSPLNGRTMSDDSLSQTRINSPPRLMSRVPRKYTTVCWLEPCNVPVHYSSTVLITLGSTRKRYTEDIRFQTRLAPRRFSESVETPVSRYYISTIEIPCNPYNHLFDGELLQVPSDSEA
ncbi:uncharacterized protein LOC126457246 isoform X2 [Schistocerca serialis cubense]|uniref:uncharacterized protein LOC126457246 isoform X2 n=1 Tax=Schistocerca serialis cubense TaxID=2023355 RepID=UPI00214F3082|nr:uncharacterized protein LOC126457246 isoform X2 [Schistocerca serialis cubense]